MNSVAVSLGYGWTELSRTNAKGKVVNVTLESNDGRYRTTIFWDSRFILYDKESKGSGVEGCVSFDCIMRLQLMTESLEEEALKYFGVEWAE